METNEKLTLTPAEAAALLGVSLPTFYQLCRREGFPSIRVGRKILISKSGLCKWLEQQTGTNFNF